MKLKNVSIEYKTVLLYLAIGVIWIYVSDTIFDIIIPDKELQTRLSIIKGFFFIIVTAGLLFGLIKNYNKKMLLARNKILEQNRNLKVANTELIEAKKKAQHNEKLKTAFLQNISHEVRTPLNGIIGFSELLNNPELPKEKLVQYTDIVIKSSQQLLNIVNDIITISTLETNQAVPKPVITDVNRIFREAYDKFFKEASAKGLKFEITEIPDDTSSSIITDPKMLNQILICLISNAIKYTVAGEIKFGCRITNNVLKIFVEDTGVGIAPQDQKRIFERFAQSKRSNAMVFGGNGLGLAISKGYTELLNGKIWLESEAEKGSKFYVNIPIKNDEETKSDKSSESKPPQKENLTLLIAEDEEYNYMYLKEVLSNHNIKLLHAKDGLEALEIFEQNKFAIDLVLMDLKMPKKDGYSVAKLIKEQRKDLPIIAQTAYALDSEVKEYEDVFDGYLTKPIQPKKLRKLLSDYTIVY